MSSAANGVISFFFAQVEKLLRPISSLLIFQFHALAVHYILPDSQFDLAILFAL